MKVLKSVLLVSLALASSGVAMASVGGNGILGTRHDFATKTNFLGSQIGADAGVANAVGQCSFCHTPHSALQTSLLWNKNPSTVTNYSWDQATTTGGTNFASMAPGYKGPTVKCLACHDGSVAIGDVAMYKGKVNPVVNTFKVGQIPLGVKSTAADGTTTGWTASDSRPQYKVGAGGLMAGTHPVGMAYPLGNVTGTYNGTTTGANVVLAEFDANPHQATANAKGGGTTVTPVSNGLGGTDALIKLYTDTGGVITAGTTAGTSGMECSTCHDPHNKQTTDDWMLRGKAQGSTKVGGYICLQCHIK